MDSEASFPFVDFSSRDATFPFHRPNGGQHRDAVWDGGAADKLPMVPIFVDFDVVPHGELKLWPVGLATCLM